VSETIAETPVNVISRLLTALGITKSIVVDDLFAEAIEPRRLDRRSKSTRALMVTA
jgi:hypothetical protein